MTEARPTDTSSAGALIEEIVTAVARLLPAEAIGVAVPSVIALARLLEQVSLDRVQRPPEPDFNDDPVPAWLADG
jgi:hypothetical protein